MEQVEVASGEWIKTLLNNNSSVDAGRPCITRCMGRVAICQSCDYCGLQGAPPAQTATPACHPVGFLHQAVQSPQMRTYRKRQPAMAKMCSCITGNRRNTIVGYGDASCNSNSPAAPLRRRLHSLCCVYNVDEFCTSMLCCACHQAGMTSPLQGTTSFLDLTLSMPLKPCV